MMKSIVLLALLWMTSLPTLQSQDLIQNTLKGISYPYKDTVVNRTAELIASRKISDAQFIKKQPLKVVNRASNKRFLEYVSEAVFLDLDYKQLEQLKKGERDITLIIPVSAAKSFELELTRVNITHDDFRVKTASGKKLTEFSGLFYRGIVKNDSHSFAAISIFNDHIRGLIADNGGNYVLGEIEEKGTGYVLYNDKNLKVKEDFVCGTDDKEIIEHQAKEQLNSKSSLPPSCVRIYIECEFALFNSRGGIIPTVDYVFALFHESATIFFNESVEVKITEIFIWDIPDPYTPACNSSDSTDNTVCLINEFQRQTPSSSGQISHLLTSRGLGGGRAERGGFTICVSESHAVSTGLNQFDPFPTFSGEVYLFTHETGHQLSSRHTHACAWNGNNTQIDDCGNMGDFQPDGVNQGCFDPDNDAPILPSSGTIMSYCNNVDNIGVNFNLGFGEQPGNRIRNFVNNPTNACFIASCDCTAFTNRTLSSSNFASSIYEASNNITAFGRINRRSREPVIFRAGNRITITNFTVTSRSTFIAEVGDDICDFSSAINNSNGVESRTAIKEKEVVEENYFAVYPTSFRETITLEFNLTRHSLSNIDIYNLSGQLVKTLKLRDMDLGFNRIEVNLGDLPSGVYHIRLRTAKQIFIQRIIKIN